MDIQEEFRKLLGDAAAETGREFAVTKDELATYMHERALHLSTIVGEPGYDQAVRAERNNVALRAGIIASDAADAVDARLLGLLGGALRIGAAVLV